MPDVASIVQMVWTDFVAISTPFAAYLIWTRRLSRSSRTAIAACYAAVLTYGVATSDSPARDLKLFAVGIGHFVLASVAVFHLTRLFADGIPNRLVWAMILMFLFALAPRLLLGADARALQTLGWELGLAAYSYSLEAAKSPRDCTLGNCLFFILVDPTVVFVERGRPVGPAGLDGAALRRGVGGLVASSVSHGLKLALRRVAMLSYVPISAVGTLSGYGRFVLHFGARLIAEYAAHSGRASLHIAWMRLVGYDVRERYVWPLFSRSPSEFWRRWNTYVGSWARRYLFTPALLSLRRGHSRLPAVLATVVAVLVSFGVMGFTHDLVGFAKYSVLGISGTFLFATHGALLLAWLGVQRWIDRRRRDQPDVQRGVGSLASWLLFMQLMLVTIWLCNPSPYSDDNGDRVAELGTLVSSR